MMLVHCHRSLAVFLSVILQISKISLKEAAVLLSVLAFAFQVSIVIFENNSGSNNNWLENCHVKKLLALLDMMIEVLLSF